MVVTVDDRAEIAAVVTLQLAPSGGRPIGSAAAVVGESRLGSGTLNLQLQAGEHCFTPDFLARHPSFGEIGSWRSTLRPLPSRSC